MVHMLSFVFALQLIRQSFGKTHLREDVNSMQYSALASYAASMGSANPWAT